MVPPLVEPICPPVGSVSSPSAPNSQTFDALGPAGIPVHISTAPLLPLLLLRSTDATLVADVRSSNHCKPTAPELPCPAIPTSASIPPNIPTSPYNSPICKLVLGNVKKPSLPNTHSRAPISPLIAKVILVPVGEGP